jgi:hypothetical protein
VNGISPFSLKDLIDIHRLLKMDLTDLVPPFLPQTESEKIRTLIEKLENPKLTLSKDEFTFAEDNSR